ncbi:hypothetical protein KAZ01_04215, partial [Candidatus Gracilibacteria bacterium]|nr:hypothetical protein [Candidatus Gracilibacteria bacterium]
MRTIKVIIYIVLGFSLLLGGFHFSFADTIQLSDHAPVIGSIITQNAGTGIFNFNDPDLMPHEVIIDGSGGYIFTGSFFLTDLNNGGTTNNYGWVTFNFGPTLSGGINTTSYRAKLITTVNPDELTMTGFAWSSGAGWIYFGEMTLSDGTTTKITYNKNRGNFSGYAWSENLGWIPMNGLKVDLNPPTLSGSTIFAASSSKLITIEDNSPISGLYKLEITNWDNNAYKIHTGTTLSFTHDFRKAKSYDAILTDPSGNSRSINSAFTVVANEPATLDTTTNIGTDPIYGGPSATGSFFKVKADNDVIADLEEKHTIDILLRDKYGNVVKTEPSIKTVDVNVLFNSTMQSKQINNIFSDGGSNLNPVIFKSDVGSTDAFSTPYISTSTYTYT